MAYNLTGGDFIVSHVATVQSFTPSEAIQLDLISSRNITFLKGTLTMNYTTSSAAPTAVEDGVAKLVQNMRLVFSGGTASTFATTDLSQMVLYNQMLYGTNIVNDQPPTATSTTGNVSVDFIMNPSLDVKDYENPKNLIPGQAPSVTQMQILGTWGTAANVWVGGTNGTINSAQLEVNEQDGWYFSNISKLKEELGVGPDGGVYIPLYLSELNRFTGAFTGLSLSIPIPKNVIVRNIFLIAKDSSEARSDSIVTDLAVKTAANQSLYGEVAFNTIQNVYSYRNNLPKITGCAVISALEDMRNSYASNSDGMIVHRTDSALEINFSTSAAGSLQVLFDCVQGTKLF